MAAAYSVPVNQQTDFGPPTAPSGAHVGDMLGTFIEDGVRRAVSRHLAEQAEILRQQAQNTIAAAVSEQVERVRRAGEQASEAILGRIEARSKEVVAASAQSLENEAEL